METKSLLTVVLGIVLLVGGCAEMSKSAGDKAAEQFQQRTAVRYVDPGLDSIRKFVPFYKNDPGVPSSLPDTCPSDEQKISINVLREKIQRVRADLMEIGSQYSYYNLHIVLESLTKIDTNLGKLYRCELTFQQYAEAHRTITNEEDEKSVIARNNRDAQRNREADEAAAYVSDMAFKQQLLYELGKKK